MIEVEPNPLLIEYWQVTQGLDCNADSSKKEFIEAGEWSYIPSNLEKTIFLFKRLEEVNLLPKELNICDCGIGLGTTMFDLYLQSKEFENIKFTFTGIEKWKPYIEFLNTNLLKYWNSELNLIESDIMNHNYDKYNLIWFYQPFRQSDKAVNFYKKVILEAQPGSIIFGLNQYQVVTYGDAELIDIFKQLTHHNLDDLICFQK